MQDNRTKIEFLKGVGPKRAEAFSSIGLTYADELLNVYPRDYIVKSKLGTLRYFIDQYVLVVADVRQLLMPRRSHQPVTLTIEDDTGAVDCLIWGKPEWRQKQFKVGDKHLFWCKVGYNAYNKEHQLDIRDHKKWEPTDDTMLKYPFLPLYILSQELKKTWIKPLSLTKIIFNAITHCTNKIQEVLSEEVRQTNRLLEHKLALLRLHYPLKPEDKEISRQTLAFEELFFLQLIMALKKKAYETSEKGISFSKQSEKQEQLLKLLEFELTNAQKKVMEEISKDMMSDKPMNRLLQGDVGSGKTIVAFHAMLRAIDNDYQCAFMCPTEILAEQHFKVMESYFRELGVNAVQLIGGQKKKLRESVLADIKSGKAQVVIGTHALIQEGVTFNNLGFIVIDEQHKFGVMQRAVIREKGLNPDVLVMTATPIPRTLSLTVYGDLNISVIDEVPKNRKPVKTYIRYEKDRPGLHKYLAEKVKEGRQVYIVYPVIDESDRHNWKPAVKHYEILKDEIFPELRVGLVHGRMFWYEIDETIEKFKNREIDILVSTTVIEVGIDIPNASIMVIEEAQKFGLSQLHQLRGRVGRGAEQSYCILMSQDTTTPEAEERLNMIVSSTDGFMIAEKDMELRGPGEFFGTRQSGELKFTAADLSLDRLLLEKARTAAFEVIDDDPQLRKQDNSDIRRHFLENYRSSMELIKVA